MSVRAELARGKHARRWSSSDVFLGASPAALFLRVAGSGEDMVCTRVEARAGDVQREAGDDRTGGPTGVG